MLAQGKPHCYRFRVPANQTVSINDCIRGKVSWNTDTLGDFVVMRSNGLPVYNFCVAVDDALMKISHVIRAEEHLPNTLRQVSNVSTLQTESCGDCLKILLCMAKAYTTWYPTALHNLRIWRACGSVGSACNSS